MFSAKYNLSEFPERTSFLVLGTVVTEPFMFCFATVNIHFLFTSATLKNPWKNERFSSHFLANVNFKELYLSECINLIPENNNKQICQSTWSDKFVTGSENIPEKYPSLAFHSSSSRVLSGLTYNLEWLVCSFSQIHHVLT